MDLVTYAVLNKKVEEAKNVSDEKISESVNAYLDENPVQPVDTATVQELKEYLGIQ